MTGFEGALADLKRRGSASLVVGSVPRDAYDRVSRRMLGESDSERSRRRLLVVPETDCEAAVDRLRATGPVDPAHARVVACNGTARSADAGTATSGDGRVQVRRIDGSLDEVGVAVSESVERLEAAAGGFSPAELRVGIDPLSAFGGYDTSATFGFFHVLTRQVRRADGMVHVRLARDRDAEAVRTLAPLFDAVVELRLDGYRLEQRWHLREQGIVSDWMAVPDAGEG